MANEMQVFDFEDKPIRAFVAEDGEPRWVGSDVCRVLEIANPGNTYRRLPDNEKAIHTMDTPSGRQEMVVVNEPGLYRLIFTSRKPEAEKFKTWVVTVVLPSIRKHGAYIHPSAVTTRYGHPPEDSEGLLAYVETLASNLRRQILLERDLRIIEVQVADNKAEIDRLARVVVQEPGWAALETFASREGVDLGVRVSVEGKAIKAMAAKRGIEPRKWKGSRYDVNIWPDALLREWLAEYRGRPSIEKAG
jgi:prophage antirepressor-like protein